MQIAYLETAFDKKLNNAEKTANSNVLDSNASLISGGFSLPVFLDLVRGGDLGLMLIGGVITLHGARMVMPWASIQSGAYVLCVLLATWMASASLNRVKAYSFSRLTSRTAQFGLLAIAMLVGSVVFCGSTALLGFRRDTVIFFPISWFAIAWLLTCGLRLVVIPFAAKWHRAGKLGRRIALLGTPRCAAEFLGDLRHAQSDGLQVTGFYEYSPSTAQLDGLGTLHRGFIGDLIHAGQHGIFDTVVVTLPSDRMSLLGDIARRLGLLPTDVYFCPDLRAECRRPLTALGGVPLLMVAERPLSDWQVVQKALFDRICAAILLIFLAPLMLTVAGLIRLESRGPALFRQTRIGFNNLPFTCFKFRTMYHHAADALADRQTTRDDERVTRLGRWLRRFSIDELPQLMNVLRGEMSLVGPRPHAPNTKAGGRLFADVAAEYALRHRVKPGITGWAQVNGWRGETITIEQIDQRIWHDLYYIRNWSILLDIRILILTVLRGFTGPQAY